MNNNNLEQWQNETNRTYSNDIDQLINHSIKKAKHDTFVHRIKMFSMILFLPFALFVTLVNTSQEFVSAINDVPILGNLANILNYNPSIYYARNTEYFQRIDQTFETDDYKLYVESMIVDEDMAVLFYKVKLKTQEHHFEWWQFENYKNMSSIFPSGISEDPNELQYVQFNPIPLISGDTFEFSFTLDDNTDPSKVTHFTVQNNSEKFAKVKTYDINQTFTFDDQKITIHSIDVYPLSTNIVVSQDPNNTYEIFKYNFSLYDKDGKKIENISNGLTGHQIDKYTDTIKLEAPYGLQNGLTLRLDQVQWVEKATQMITYNKITNKVSNLTPNLQVKEIDSKGIKLNVIRQPNDMHYTFSSSDSGVLHMIFTDHSEVVSIPFSSLKEDDNYNFVIKNTFGMTHDVYLDLVEMNLNE